MNRRKLSARRKKNNFIRDIYLAIQCCQHLNRALVVEKACADEYDLERVIVLPTIHAGGALATMAMKKLSDLVVVQRIKA